MIIPIRCFSCGKPIAQYWEDYQKQVVAGKSPKEVMDSLGIDRFCCRSIFLTHVDLIKRTGIFKK